MDRKKNITGHRPVFQSGGPRKTSKGRSSWGGKCSPSISCRTSFLYVIFLSEFIWFVSCFHACSLSSWQTHEMFSSSAHCRIHSYSWGKTSHQWNSQRKGQAQFLFRPVDPRANVIGIIRKIARPKDWSSKSFPIMTVIIYTGWWYTYASEKYEFVSWHDCSQYMEKCNSCSKRPTSTPFLLPEIWNSHEGGEDGMPGMPCKCSLHLFLGAAVWLHHLVCWQFSIETCLFSSINLPTKYDGVPWLCKKLPSVIHHSNYAGIFHRNVMSHLTNQRLLHGTWELPCPSVSQAEIAALTLTTPGDPTAKCRISSSRAQRHSAHFSQALMAAFHVVSSQGLRESNC